MPAVAVPTAPRVRVIARSGESRARLARVVERAGISVMADDGRSGAVDVVVATPDVLPSLGAVPLLTGVVVVGGDPAAVTASFPFTGRAWAVLPDSVDADVLGAAIH